MSIKLLSVSHAVTVERRRGRSDEGELVLRIRRVAAGPEGGEVRGGVELRPPSSFPSRVEGDGGQARTGPEAEAQGKRAPSQGFPGSGARPG